MIDLTKCPITGHSHKWMLQPPNHNTKPDDPCVFICTSCGMGGTGKQLKDVEKKRHSGQP